MNYTKLIKQLPGSLQRRFWSLHHYIRVVIETDEEGLPQNERTKPDTIDAIATVVFSASLSRFLHDGTKAAIKAVDAFKDIGLESFKIGKAEFSGRNENVMLGENLATGIDTILVEHGLDDFANKSESIASMINRLHGIL